jgi:hypothetical protein
MLLASQISQIGARSIPQGDLDDITRLKFEFLVRVQVFAAVAAFSHNRYRGLVAKSACKL